MYTLFAMSDNKIPIPISVSVRLRCNKTRKRWEHRCSQSQWWRVCFYLAAEPGVPRDTLLFRHEINHGSDLSTKFDRMSGSCVHVALKFNICSPCMKRKPNIFVRKMWWPPKILCCGPAVQCSKGRFCWAVQVANDSGHCCTRVRTYVWRVERDGDSLTRECRHITSLGYAHWS